jgi:hypothetical protein
MLLALDWYPAALAFDVIATSTKPCLKNDVMLMNAVTLDEFEQYFSIRSCEGRSLQALRRLAKVASIYPPSSDGNYVYCPPSADDSFG